MNLNLTECQVLSALKKQLNDNISIKPFIANKYDDFTIDKNTAYYGRFDSLVNGFVRNFITGVSFTDIAQGNTLFTHTDLQNIGFNFQGYKITSNIALYEAKRVEAVTVSDDEYENICGDLPPNFPSAYNTRLYCVKIDETSENNMDEGDVLYIDSELKNPFVTIGRFVSPLDSNQDKISTNENGVVTFIDCGGGLE